jgi:AcrR family transcriptional regulator
VATPREVPSRASVRRADVHGTGRPRDPRAHQAILDAVLELLHEGGYGRVTVEAIAGRAHVGKSTIYRRWSSKGPLVVEALGRMLHLGPAVDTGDVRQDLQALLRRVVGVVGQPLLTLSIPGLVADLGADPDLAAAFRQTFIDPKRARVALLLDQAVARGQLDPGVDAELVTDLLVGPVLWRAILTGAPLDEGFISGLVDHVTRGIGLAGTDLSGEHA